MDETGGEGARGLAHFSVVDHSHVPLAVVQQALRLQPEIHIWNGLIGKQ